MTRLARLFNFTWIRSGQPGKYAYQLIQERKSAEHEEALRQRDWRLALDNLARDLAKPPQADTVDPAQRIFVNRVLALMDEQQTQALTAGRTVYFSTFADGKAKTLPPPLRQELIRLHRESCEKSVRDGNAASAPGNLEETFAALKGLRLSLWMEPRVTSDALQASLTLRSHGVFPPGTGRFLNPFGPYVGSGLHRFPLPAPPAPDEAAAKWANDPLLSRRRAFRMEPLKSRAVRGRRRTHRRLHEILPAIAQVYGVDFIADAYREQRLPPQPSDQAEELNLYEALNRYAYPSAEWNKSGSIFEVRSRGWHFDRLPELPDRFVAEWAERLRKAHRMTLDETAPLVTALRDLQLQHLGSRLREEGVDIGGGYYLEMAKGGREILCAYQSLTPAQRLALKAGERLSPVNMPPAAREWLSRAGERAARIGFSPSDLNPLPPGLLSLRLERIEKTFVPTEGDQIRFRWKNLDGGVFSGNGVTQRESAPPGFTDPGQITQYVTFTYEMDQKQTASFAMHLPWAYLDPLPLPDGVP